MRDFNCYKRLTGPSTRGHTGSRFAAQGMCLFGTRVRPGVGAGFNICKPQFIPHTAQRNELRANKKGFIALVSSIIIAVILLTAVVSLGSRGIMGRFILLDIENKQVSQALAEACVQIAMIQIVNDAEYVAANVPAYVDTKTCTIVSVESNTPSAGESTIKTKGESRGATTNVEVVLDSATANFISWEEKSSF